MSENSFTLFSGNDPEILCRKLAQLLRQEPRRDPFASREIIVQSQGMSAFLKQNLTRELGILCNVNFPFLNRAVDEILHLTLPQNLRADLDFFRPEVMKFAIMEELLRLSGDPAKDGALFSFAHYLKGARREERARQLADVLAIRMEQYQIYRPETMLRGTLADPSQRELWKRLCAEKISRPAVFDAFFRQKEAPALQERFDKLYLFGIGTLPPLYFWFFRKVSEFLPVIFFYQTPCRGEWSECAAPLAWNNVQDPLPDLPEENLLSGNPLLSSWGKAGRDFFNTILEASDYDPDAPEALFRDPGNDTLLHALQQDIFFNQNRTDPQDGSETPQAKHPVSPEDRSLRLHNCHHPMREVEVLHDELLHFFAEDPTRTAGDVLVMAPDIEKYEPYIRAVFSRESGRTIPFSIGDRSDEVEQEVWDAFFSLPKLFQGRMTMPEVLELLESSVVYSRFGIARETLPELRELLQKSHTFWGIDEEHRKACLDAGSAFSGGTLTDLNDRLLLGMAMAPAEDGTMIPFADQLPIPLLSGDALVLAAALEQFLTVLCRFARQCAAPRTPASWSVLMQEMLRELFSDRPPYRDAVSQLRSAIETVAANAERASLRMPLEAETVFAETEGILAGNRAFHASGFLRGAVTFCTMRPMRNVPHRMICLLGMSENDYPRRENQTNLDWIWRHPCRGDRSIRTEDRFLFLEALLAARERLRIFYCGQNPQNNTPSPPSTLVSELLQYLKANYDLPLQKKDLLWHRKEMLHAYHPVYFEEGERATFSREAYRIAQFASKPAAEKQEIRFPLESSPVTPEESFETEMTLQKLYRFFSNPFAVFAQEVLQIPDPGWEEKELSADEPQTLQWKGEWDLLRALNKTMLSDHPAERQMLPETMKTAGVLPAEPFGQWALTNYLRQREIFFRQKQKALNNMTLQQWIPTAESFALPPELQLGTILDVMRNEDTIAVFFSAKYSAKSWIAGYLLQILRGEPDSYVLCFEDKVMRLPGQTPHTLEFLREEILSLREEGSLFPLRFMPESSYALATGKKPESKWYSAFADSGEWTHFAVRYFCACNDLETHRDEWLRNACRFFGEEAK